MLVHKIAKNCTCTLQYKRDVNDNNTGLSYVKHLIRKIGKFTKKHNIKIAQKAHKTLTYLYSILKSSFSKLKQIHVV